MNSAADIIAQLTSLAPELRYVDQGEHTYEVFFPNGDRAVIYLGEDRRWRGFFPGDEYRVYGHPSHDVMYCIVQVYEAWMKGNPPAPLKMGTDDAEAIVSAAHGMSGKEYGALVKKLLKERTGLTFSVRAGGGVAYATVKVSAPKGRRLTPHEVGLLGVCLKIPMGTGGGSIGPENKHRARVIQTLIGR